jgi:hypothetical protein
LQFETSIIVDLAGTPDKREKQALAAGSAIAKGKHARKNLDIIFRWKTRGRGISRLKRNKRGEIVEALAVAAAAENERTAIAGLCGLYGVNVPVASAILTCIAPKRYTIIDFRALQALGNRTTDRSIEFYLEYLQHCRGLARRCDVTLRQLDRALWNWSKNKGNK